MRVWSLGRKGEGSGLSVESGPARRADLRPAWRFRFRTVDYQLMTPHKKTEEVAKPSMVKRAASFLGLAKQAPTVSKVSTLHAVE